MIAIVILGLGLIMVATMFPVAWSRARTLSEATMQQSITDNAEVVVENLTRVSGAPSGSVLTYATSFEGDLQFDLSGFPVRACEKPPYDSDPFSRVVSDTWVHALNLETLLIAPGTGEPRVGEEPWALADPDGVLRLLKKNLDGNPPTSPATQFLAATFFSPRIDVSERVFPPLGPRPPALPATPATAAALARWDEQVTSSRFSWAVFHRLRSLRCFDIARPDYGAARTFDMFYVTLRRPQPTHRYARQDPGFTPNPCTLATAATAPRAIDPKLDVVFPIAWRVQVQFPPSAPAGSIVQRWTDDTRTTLTGDETGVPTEIEVPAPTLASNIPVGVMFVQMFPPGTQFIDEITGQVYRVVKRRVIGNEGEKAVLTLDREVVFEDLNLPEIAELCGAVYNPPLVDPRCDCDPTRLIDEELLRAVWVFPPPVEPGRGASDLPVFDGNSPVVGIDVRTLTVAPVQ